MGIFKKPAQVILENLFSKLIPEGNRSREIYPNHRFPNSYQFVTHSFDGTQLNGWMNFPSDTPKGTAIFCHGFSVNCLNEQIIELASYVSDEFNFVTGSFDFRHHGHSGNAPPTFGAAEARDIMSVLDYAESVNAPKPYILIGESLGALAIQRATIEDNRISGSVLLSSPGWPWDAIGKQIGLGVPVGKMIDKAYGYNILTDGDIRRHNSNPPHNPKILYIIGEKDMFDWRQTQKCFNHWYGTEGIINVWPKDLLEQNKWFIVAPGLEHPDDDNYNRALNIKNYPEIYGLIHQFMTLLLEKN